MAESSVLDVHLTEVMLISNEIFNVNHESVSIFAMLIIAFSISG